MIPIALETLEMKYLSALVLISVASLCNANDEQATTPNSENVHPIVIVCPEHSANSGDEVPTWATTVDAVNFYCNDKQEPDTPPETENEEG